MCACNELIKRVTVALFERLTDLMHIYCTYVHAPPSCPAHPLLTVCPAVPCHPRVTGVGGCSEGLNCLHCLPGGEDKAVLHGLAASDTGGVPVVVGRGV